jgi:hypothetical protein
MGGKSINREDEDGRTRIEERKRYYDAKNELQKKKKIGVGAVAKRFAEIGRNFAFSLSL